MAGQSNLQASAHKADTLTTRPPKPFLTFEEMLVVAHGHWDSDRRELCDRPESAGKAGPEKKVLKMHKHSSTFNLKY